MVHGEPAGTHAFLTAYAMDTGTSTGSTGAASLEESVEPM